MILLSVSKGKCRIFIGNCQKNNGQTIGNSGTGGIQHQTACSGCESHVVVIDVEFFCKYTFQQAQFHLSTLYCPFLLPFQSNNPPHILANRLPLPKIQT